MTATLTISTAQRRLRLLRRHHLASECPAGGVAEAARGVVVLHATDPASVTVSALVRDPSLTRSDVMTALHAERSVLRMMAMRRTLFVVPLEIAPIIHAAASLAIGARQWTQLVKWLGEATDPPLDDVPDKRAWLREIGDEVVAVVERRGAVSGTEIAAEVPRLKTVILPVGNGKSYDVPRGITPLILMALGCDGRIVRGEPGGGWTSRRHRWEPASTWWPDGLPVLDPAVARVELVRLWLARFAPATVADIQWWTGWTLGDTRKALAELAVLPVELAHGPGIVLADDIDPVDEVAPVVNLLPALDPTAMGWKERDWYFDVDRTSLFDRNGNIGPTVWWNGGVVGGWATRADGAIRFRVLTDIGAAGATAVAAAADDLQRRLEGAAIVPSFRVPLERELATG